MKLLPEIIKAITPLVAIIALVIIEIIALSNGIDGTLLAVTCAIVGGLGGYETNAIKDLVKKAKNG